MRLTMRMACHCTSQCDGLKIVKGWPRHGPVPHVHRGLSTQLGAGPTRRPLFSNNDGPSKREIPMSKPEKNSMRRDQDEDIEDEDEGHYELVGDEEEDVEEGYPDHGIGSTGPDVQGLVAVRHIEQGAAWDRGTGSIKSKSKVWVLWDLDNLHPNHVNPGALVWTIKNCVGQFGSVVQVTAFGNDATFRWVPPTVREERVMVKDQMVLEKQALRAGSKKQQNKALAAAGLGGQLHVCQMCGRKLRTSVELQKHFKQLHEREFKKKLSHKPLAKKIFKDKEYVDKYFNARLAAGAAPKGKGGSNKGGMNLSRLLRNEGVQVVSVPVKPEAVDQALVQAAHKLLHGMRPAGAPPPTNEKGFQRSLCIISDDSDFEKVLQDARAAGWGALAVCSEKVLLGRQAAQAKVTDMPYRQRSLLIGSRSDGLNWLGEPVQGAYEGAHATLDFRAMQQLAQEQEEEEEDWVLDEAVGFGYEEKDGTWGREDVGSGQWFYEEFLA